MSGTSRVAHLLTHRCSISRATRTVVDAQVIQAAAVVATNVPCRVSSPRATGVAGQVYAGAELARRPKTIYFNPTQDVRRDDDLIINGASYRVLDVDQQLDGAYLMASAELLA